MPASIFAAPAAGRAALPPSRPRSVATACTLVLLASVSGAHADDTTDTLPRIEVTASPFGATGLGLNLPAAAGLAAISLPLVAVVLGHGAFDAQAVSATALALCGGGITAINHEAHEGHEEDL